MTNPTTTATEVMSPEFTTGVSEKVIFLKGAILIKALLENVKTTTWKAMNAERTMNFTEQ